MLRAGLTQMYNGQVRCCSRSGLGSDCCVISMRATVRAAPPDFAYPRASAAVAGVPLPDDPEGRTGFDSLMRPHPCLEGTGRDLTLIYPSSHGAGGADPRLAAVCCRLHLLAPAGPHWCAPPLLQRLAGFLSRAIMPTLDELRVAMHKQLVSVIETMGTVKPSSG